MIIKDFNILKQKVWKVANRLLNSAGSSSLEESVSKILQEIHEAEDKEAKIKELTLRFDKKTVSELKISTQGHFEKLKPDEKKAIELASKRIKNFHTECLPEEVLFKDGSDELSVVYKPIDSVGLYIPGGTAPLLSTLMMTAIPALVAGVERIVVTSPPTIHPYILAVADYLGIKEIYQLGGVQAIAGLANGLPNLEAVDKIFGPGNQFVTAAKKMV
ncbi:MAG: histidinol dehydrogenase, partial [Candidatus Caenarcaniphilales bacterium]|nr:histidinol dehydrogenase [Candidatus Caenarcaniphilales bacterium]